MCSNILGFRTITAEAQAQQLAREPRPCKLSSMSRMEKKKKKKARQMMKAEPKKREVKKKKKIEKKIKRTT